MHKQYRISPQIVGFENLFDRLERITSVASGTDYPPHNVIQTDEHKYSVELAVAGFGEQDLSVTIKNEELVVEGAVESGDDETKFLHKGISSRKFRRTFALADHMKVKGASVKNGILSIELEREVPEELKPQTIKIDFKG